MGAVEVLAAAMVEARRLDRQDRSRKPPGVTALIACGFRLCEPNVSAMLRAGQRLAENIPRTRPAREAIDRSGVIMRYQLAQSQSARLTQHHDVRLWPAAVRYVHMRTICPRFKDSSRHVVSSGHAACESTDISLAYT